MEWHSFRYSKFLTLVDKNSSPLEKVKAYLECHERDRVPNQENLFDEKINFSWPGIHNILLPYFDNSLSLLDQVFLADYNGKLLYNFSIIGNKINQFFNLKSVTPILNSKLITYASQIHPDLKYNSLNNIGKIPLRLLLKNLNVEQFVNNMNVIFLILISKVVFSVLERITLVVFSILSKNIPISRK